MWSDFCLNRQDIIFANRTAELRGLKLSTKTRKRRIIFLFDWRNTPNSHRNQYKADRWFSIEQRSLKKRGKLTWFSQPMNSLFSDIWIRWRKEKLFYNVFPSIQLDFWEHAILHVAPFIFHFLSVKYQLLNQDQSFNFRFCLTSLVWRFTDLFFSIRVLYKINAFILSERH